MTSSAVQLFSAETHAIREGIEMEFRYRLAGDNSGCEHRSLVGPNRIEERVHYGHCHECGREVAAELDKGGQRTGRTWLVEYEPPVSSR